MIDVYFMRWRGRNRPYSYVADNPVRTGTKCDFVDPFFIIRAHEPVLPPELLEDRTVRLNLDLLQSKDEYKDKIVKYLDENGEEKERIEYGYFSEFGRSDAKNPPIITVDDILRGDNG